MSRIGKQPVKIPGGVVVKVVGLTVEVSGPMGNLKMVVNPAVKIEIEGAEVRVKVQGEENGNLHGLTRSLVQNMVKGVTEGWSKTLELNGTGFRAASTGSELQLALGFSHPVIVKAPAEIQFEVKENRIIVSGTDKALVGELAAKIRGLKPADPYKLKGFKYLNEIIIKKAGKAAKAAA